jgi:hypothetical protein
MRRRNAVALGLLAAMLASGPAWSAPESSRAALRQLMAERPRDPWPRGLGHVVLGLPGTPDSWKAYHEPGGSFSPAFGSFGISLWVVDGQGRLLTTSDTVPLDNLKQRWVWPDKPSWPARPDFPGVRTVTAHYDVTWQVLGPARYQMHLRSTSDSPVWIMVRGPGPAGAALKSLHAAGGKLFVSDRWALNLKGRGADLEVAPPGPQDPGVVRPPAYFWAAERPYGYARYRLLPRQEYWLEIEDAFQPPQSSLPPSRGRSSLKLSLPDPRFEECLNAQVAQLLTGLVGNETRPGEPNHYPLNWLRDGAHVIAALARAGQLEVAQELCVPFAAQDFFGGFGAEADAPGLALWALEEVAVRVRDRDFDSGLWPHVVRKAELIQLMMSTKEPIRRPFVGPVVPRHEGKPDLDLVCEAARDGLIVGRMDWHRPLLYVNAVSYGGLMSAATMAERLGRPEAGAWKQSAASLRSAWERALRTAEAANERTAVCGLHPTWVAGDREAYTAVLEPRWAAQYDAKGGLRSIPLWTYFTLAEAHQWLFLGRPQRAWTAMDWFWSNQASAGLYTWWEGEGEENAFGRWAGVRGWVNPPHVTPHYWTAAEMVMLQLDALACVEPTGGEPILHVGLGIPSWWLEGSLRVEGMSTSLGIMDWEWSKGRLTVRLPRQAVQVKPGPGFPANAVLRVKP